MKIVDDDGKGIAEGWVLSLQPGDVLVLQAEKRLDMQTRKDIIGRLEGMFPDNKAIVLDEGVELNIVRRPAEVGAL